MMRNLSSSYLIRMKMTSTCHSYTYWQFPCSTTLENLITICTWLGVTSISLCFHPATHIRAAKLKKDLTVPEVMKCFSKEGELPRVFPTIEIYSDVEREYAAIVPYYLRSAVYIGVRGHISIATEHAWPHFRQKRLPSWRFSCWMTGVIMMYGKSNDFIAFLCFYPCFFSTFRMFNIAGLGFIIS